MLSGTTLDQLKKLQRVVNASGRFLLAGQESPKLSSFMMDAGWLPIKFKVQLQIVRFVFLSLNSRTSKYLQDLLTVRECNSTIVTRSSSTVHLSIPRTKTRIGDRAFSVCGPKLWNSLPSDVRMCRSYSSFIAAVTKYFLEQWAAEIGGC